VFEKNTNMLLNPLSDFQSFTTKAQRRRLHDYWGIDSSLTGFSFTLHNAPWRVFIAGPFPLVERRAKLARLIDDPTSPLQLATLLLVILQLSCALAPA
jgi:hypothetical protein